MMSCSRQEYCFRQLHTLIQTKINIHTSFISKFLLASFHDQIDRTFDRDKMAMRNQIITVLCMVIAVLGFWTVWNLLNAADGVDTLEKFRKVTDSFARSDPEEVAVDDSLVKGDDLDLSLNAELDVLDAGKWYRGRVIGRHQEKREVKIHYFGWDAKYDIWIPDNSDRLAPRGTKWEPKDSFSVDGQAICGLKQSYNMTCANGSAVTVGCHRSRGYIPGPEPSWVVKLTGSHPLTEETESFSFNENVTSTDSRVRRLCGVHDLECTINNTSICAQR
eukprot:970782_1